MKRKAPDEYEYSRADGPEQAPPVDPESCDLAQSPSTQGDNNRFSTPSPLPDTTATILEIMKPKDLDNEHIRDESRRALAEKDQELEKIKIESSHTLAEKDREIEKVKIESVHALTEKGREIEKVKSESGHALAEKDREIRKMKDEHRRALANKDQLIKEIKLERHKALASKDQDIKTQRKISDELRQNLAKTVASLADEKRMLQISYEVVSKVQENLKAAQDRTADLERSLADFQHNITKISERDSISPIAVVLVDGDGYIFDWDHYIKMGVRGGERAAHDLNEEVRRYFAATNFPNESHWTIIAKVYCTFGGLVRAMNDKGITVDLNTMHSFAVGFTKSMPGFDMIDVGQGKERADSKLQFWFNQHILDVRCKHIILAVTHDAGYLTMLDRYKYDRRYATPTTLSSHRR